MTERNVMVDGAILTRVLGPNHNPVQPGSGTARTNPSGQCSRRLTTWRAGDASMISILTSWLQLHSS